MSALSCMEICFHANETHCERFKIVGIYNDGHPFESLALVFRPLSTKWCYTYHLKSVLCSFWLSWIQLKCPIKCEWFNCILAFSFIAGACVALAWIFSICFTSIPTVYSMFYATFFFCLQKKWAYLFLPQLFLPSPYSMRTSKKLVSIVFPKSMNFNWIYKKKNGICLEYTHLISIYCIKAATT